MKVELRELTRDDLPILYEQQNDSEAHEMVGITSHTPDDRAAYFEKWEKRLPDPEVSNKTILYEGRVAGNILCFLAPWSEKREVGYWLGREFWGLGIASEALSQFLEIEKQRPLFATAAAHNKASVRILEKCGFEKSGSEKVIVERTGKEIEEFIFELR